MSNDRVTIVGAGAAGLAVAACLTRAGIPNLILEQSDQVGATWRRHYDRLHLHTDKKKLSAALCALPQGISTLSIP